jgi:hypothetical protein
VPPVANARNVTLDVIDGEPGHLEQIQSQIRAQLGRLHDILKVMMVMRSRYFSNNVKHYSFIPRGIPILFMMMLAILLMVDY